PTTPAYSGSMMRLPFVARRGSAAAPRLDTSRCFSCESARPGEENRAEGSGGPRARQRKFGAVPDACWRLGGWRDFLKSDFIFTRESHAARLAIPIPLPARAGPARAGEGRRCIEPDRAPPARARLPARHRAARGAPRATRRPDDVRAARVALLSAPLRGAAHRGGAARLPDGRRPAFTR